MDDLKVGDEVTWTSHGGGLWKTKVGRVVEVVGPSEMPKTFKPKGRSNVPRGFASFVVKTPDRTYWPRDVVRK